MPPRTHFTRDRVVEAAFDLTRRDGIDAFSARGVAAELGCSTAPVFSQFDGMEALHAALLDRIIAFFVATIERLDDWPDPLFASGYGMVRFAADEPNLYEALFLRQHRQHNKWLPVRRRLARRMADHPRYAHLDEDARFGLVGRASVVMHGLGVEVWFRRLPSPTQATLKRLLEELAGPVVDAALANGWTRDIHSATSPETSPAPSPVGEADGLPRDPA